MRGQGPLSKALRAAATARLISAACASAMLKNNSSVPELTTSIFDALEGDTHCPLMKNRSGWARGAVAAVMMELLCGASGGRIQEAGSQSCRAEPGRWGALALSRQPYARATCSSSGDHHRPTSPVAQGQKSRG